jgi:hypothetical protein
MWAVVVLARERRWRPVLGLVAVLAVSGVAFLVAHQAWYGGWTAYAAGDHFVGGELTVTGTDPQLAARSVRLVGLLTDRQFGLIAWAPAFLLVVPALAGLVRRRPPAWSLLVGIVAAGWLNATFVALTMHGWWWPGRQVVLVLPALVLATAWFLAHARAARWWRGAFVVATALGVATWLWLLVEVLTGQRQLIIDFADTGMPWYRLWRTVLPDGQVWSSTDQLGLALWTAVLAVGAYLGGRAVAPPTATDLRSPQPRREL